MAPTPPPLHFPSPYALPSSPLATARYIQMADGARIACYVYESEIPSGEPVLMLHGNGEDHNIFGSIIDAVYDAGHCVIAPDSRAQGLSTRGSTRPLSYELMAEDALAVLDALEISQAHVLGFSDGAIEALLLARDHPCCVLSLTALGANLTPEGVIEDEEWDLSATIAQHRAWAKAWSTQESSSAIDTSLLVPSPEQSAITAELLQLMLDEPHIPAESLSAISCPTTIMVGEFDCITPEETNAIHQAIAGSRLVVVPEAGHTLPKQVPERVAEELLATIALC